MKTSETMRTMITCSFISSMSSVSTHSDVNVYFRRQYKIKHYLFSKNIGGLRKQIKQSTSTTIPGSGTYSVPLENPSTL